MIEIPPIHSWTGNRWAPSLCVMGHCSRCGDFGELARKAIKPPEPRNWWTTPFALTKDPIEVRELCAWCWIVDAWDEKRRKAHEHLPRALRASFR